MSSEATSLTNAMGKASSGKYTYGPLMAYHVAMSYIHVYVAGLKQGSLVTLGDSEKQYDEQYTEFLPYF